MTIDSHLINVILMTQYTMIDWVKAVIIAACILFMTCILLPSYSVEKFDTDDPVTVDTSFVIRHVNSGKCLHAKGDPATPGKNTPVIFDTCSADKNNNINVIRYRYLPDIKQIQHSSNMCLEPRKNDLVPADGTSVVFNTCKQIPQFQFLANGSIQHVSSGKCIKMSKNGATLNTGCSDSNGYFRADGVDCVAFDDSDDQIPPGIRTPVTVTPDMLRLSDENSQSAQSILTSLFQ